MHVSDEDSSSPFDEALQTAGGFGRFQIYICILLFVATVHYSSNHSTQIFILLPPDQYFCPSIVNSTDGEYERLLKCDFKKSHDHVESKEQEIIGVLSNETTSTCPQGWRYEMGNLFPTIATQNHWVCNESWRQYATHSVFSIGSMIGFMVSGFLSDKYGRKPTIVILASLSAVTNIIPLWVTNDYAIMFARFLAGVSADTVCSIAFLLVMEYTVPSHRTLVGATWATTWTILGGIYPWYAYLIFHYKYLLITTSAVSLLLIAICPFIPESASWLVSAGNTEDALENLMKIAKFNGKKDVTEIEFKKLLLAIESSSNSDCGSIDSSTSESSFWGDTMALINTPNLRKTTILLFSSWFLICLCYHADFLGVGHLGLSIYPTYSMSVAFELPVNIFTMFCLDHVGRRWPNVFFMASAGCLAFTFALIEKASETVTMILAVLLIVTLAGSYNITYQLAAELFPTVVRGRGVLLSKVFGDLGNILATMVAFLVEINANILMLVVGCLAFVASFLLFFIPETTHEPLPQTLEDGEEFGIDQSLCYCPLFTKPKTHRSRHDATRSSLSNVSYTAGRPANSVQPMATTPRQANKFPNGKQAKRQDSVKQEKPDTPVVVVAPTKTPVNTPVGSPIE